jgi:hypothetical protein
LLLHCEPSRLARGQAAAATLERGGRHFVRHRIRRRRQRPFVDFGEARAAPPERNAELGILVVFAGASGAQLVSDVYRVPLLGLLVLVELLEALTYSARHISGLLVRLQASRLNVSEELAVAVQLGLGGDALVLFHAGTWKRGFARQDFPVQPRQS